MSEIKIIESYKKVEFEKEINKLLNEEFKIISQDCLIIKNRQPAYGYDGFNEISNVKYAAILFKERG